MKQTSSAPIITQARALLKKRRCELSEEEQQNIEREIGYFETNAERMRYGAYLVSPRLREGDDGR